MFAVVEYIPKNVLRGCRLDMADFFWETIGGLTYWFTSALVVAQIIILLILLTRCRNVWVYWLSSMLIMACGFYMTIHDMNFLGLSRDLWLFKHGLLSIAFITAGGLYWKYELDIRKCMNKYILVLMAIIYFLIFTLFNKDIHVLVSHLDVNWIGYFAGCFASILLIEICKCLPEIRIMTFIGQNSISFYFMSGALPIVLSMIMNKFLGTPTWYGLLIIWLLSLIVAYGATYLFNRFTPWLFDLRKLREK